MYPNTKELRNIRADLKKYEITMTEVANELNMTPQNVSINLRHPEKSKNMAVINLCKEKIKAAKDAEANQRKRA